MDLLKWWQTMMAAVAVLEEAFAAGSSTAAGGGHPGSSTADAHAAAEGGAGSTNPEQTLSKKTSLALTLPESGTAAELDSCPSIPEEVRKQFAEMSGQVAELEATVNETKKYVGTYRLFNMCRKVQQGEKTIAQRAGAAVCSAVS